MGMIPTPLPVRGEGESDESWQFRLKVAQELNRRAMQILSRSARCPKCGQKTVTLGSSK
jgi:predicted Zn-ribbon and HTH transcriptional regulator